MISMAMAALLQTAVLSASPTLTYNQAFAENAKSGKPLVVLVGAEWCGGVPRSMVKARAGAIRTHRLRHEILATKVANRCVNRLGPSMPLGLTGEEGASLGQVAVAFLAAEHLLDLPKLWERMRTPQSKWLGIPVGTP